MTLQLFQSACCISLSATATRGLDGTPNPSFSNEGFNRTCVRFRVLRCFPLLRVRTFPSASTVRTSPRMNRLFFKRGSIPRSRSRDIWTITEGGYEQQWNWDLDLFSRGACCVLLYSMGYAWGRFALWCHASQLWSTLHVLTRAMSFSMRSTPL